MNFKLRTGLLLIICLIFTCTTAHSEFSFPSGLTEIDEEAFESNTLITSLMFPEGLTRIGPRAFANCTSLNVVSIPGSVTSIDAGAFDNCGESLLIKCRPGSAAHTYAIENEIDYQAETTYLALVIGQTYTGTSYALQGPANDMNAVRFCLINLGWSVTAKSNLSSSEILSSIGSAFSSATENSVSLFYYSGHGMNNGSLIGSIGNEYVSPSQLRAALDQIPGRKVVIVDACYSGQLIVEESAAQNNMLMAENSTTIETNNQDEANPPDFAAQFISAFQSAFSHTKTRGALNAGSYFVITAARGDEESLEMYITSGGTGRIMGIFTNGFCLGLGYNGITMKSTSLNADSNQDQAVSIQEIYTWAFQEAMSMNASQHASVWPSGCRWFAPFRQ